MIRQRLDRWMVDHGLAETREKAQALIMAGEVLLNGQKAVKPGQSVPPDPHIEVRAQLRYVSRGGLKLEAALARFSIDVAGQVCADFGSSTGGFTDCLLQHGAARVHAIDVGTNQLDWRLRIDPRVVVHENRNARFLTPGDLGESVALAVCDVSFISVLLIVPAIVEVLNAAPAAMVILIKPQFEAGRENVGKGGIVRDPAIHAEVCAKVRTFVESRGFRTGIMESPITGAEGNKEFLLYAQR